jgi:hypothetical protein
MHQMLSPLSRAQTELRNYWKRNLEGKIEKQGGRYHGKGNRNDSAYTFSGGKQSGNQGRGGPSRQGQQQQTKETRTPMLH